MCHLKKEEEDANICEPLQASLLSIVPRTTSISGLFWSKTVLLSLLSGWFHPPTTSINVIMYLKHSL